MNFACLIQHSLDGFQIGRTVVSGIVDGHQNSLDAAFDGLLLLLVVHEKIVVLNMYIAL